MAAGLMVQYWHRRRRHRHPHTLSGFASFADTFSLCLRSPLDGKELSKLEALQQLAHFGQRQICKA